METIPPSGRARTMSGRARALAREAGFALIGVCAAIAVYVFIRMYQRRSLRSFGDADLVFADGRPMTTQLHVVGTVGTCRTVFLVDTGFSGPLVVNEAVLAAAADHGPGWNALSYRAIAARMDAEQRDVPTREARDLVARYGMRIDGAYRRTLQALSGVETREVLEGAAALSIGGSDAQEVTMVTDFVPHTGCIMTIDLLVRMRPVVLDFGAARFRTAAPVPPDAWTPRQDFDDVVFLSLRVGGRSCRLIMDTGYGGCIALNRDTARAIQSAQPCAVTDETITQFDVHDNEVCASVMRLPCELLTEDGDAVSLGGDLPIYANATSVDGDGLLGLELLRRLSFLVIDASALRTPRVLLGPPRDLDWCDAHGAVGELSATRCRSAPLQRGAQCPTVAPACSVGGALRTSRGSR